jgi:hypothetical protein
MVVADGRRPWQNIVADNLLRDYSVSKDSFCVQMNKLVTRRVGKSPVMTKVWPVDEQPYLSSSNTVSEFVSFSILILGSSYDRPIMAEGEQPGPGIIGPQ